MLKYSTCSAFNSNSLCLYDHTSQKRWMSYVHMWMAAGQKHRSVLCMDVQRGSYCAFHCKWMKAGREVHTSQRQIIGGRSARQVHGLCLCVCAEGIGGRGSVGRQSWEGHHCLITAMLVTSSWRWLCSLPLCLGVIQVSMLKNRPATVHFSDRLRCYSTAQACSRSVPVSSLSCFSFQLHVYNIYHTCLVPQCLRRPCRQFQLWKRRHNNLRACKQHNMVFIKGPSKCKSVHTASVVYVCLCVFVWCDDCTHL